MIYLFQQAPSALSDWGAIVGIIGGVVSGLIGTYAVVHASKAKAKTAELEIHAKTFEVETLAEQAKAKIEIDNTKLLLESWKEQSKGQASRIELVENNYNKCIDSHNKCEIRCAKLEGQVEMLSTLQGVTAGRVSTQAERQNLQEKRQNTQEERQNFLSIKADDAPPDTLIVESAKIDAKQVEVKKDGGDKGE